MKSSSADAGHKRIKSEIRKTTSGELFNQAFMDFMWAMSMRKEHTKNHGQKTACALIWFPLSIPLAVSVNRSSIARLIVLTNAKRRVAEKGSSVGF